MLTTPLQITNMRLCTWNPLSLWQEASSFSVYLFLIVAVDYISKDFEVSIKLACN